MIRCKRMGWREKGEASYIPGGGNMKVRHVFYDLSKAEVMNKLLKALGRDPVIKAQDVYDHDADDLRDDKLVHLYGQSVRSRLVKSDDPRDRSRAGRQSDQDRIDNVAKELEDLIKAEGEQFRREKKAPPGAICPLHDRNLVAKSRCPVCGLGYRIFDREGSLR